ncbi:MAG: hypothetical protein J6B50_04580 [Lachnospiraceae bacterium]|nr:hypothetical protein [Lachnospiraceae bacterium]
MPGIHKNNTISFRPSEWERNLIEERARLSGMCKKDFITRSCIYSRVCVVGDVRNVRMIVDAVVDMRCTLKEIASSISAGDFVISTDGFDELKKEYLATCLALVEILDGASYLFDRGSNRGSVLRTDDQLTQLLASVNIDYKNGDIFAEGDNLGL